MIDFTALNLTYSTQEKTKKLIKLNHQRKFYQYIMCFFGVLSAVFLLFFFTNADQYADLFLTGPRQDSASRIDSTNLYFMLIFTVSFYVSFLYWKKKKDKFDNIRKDLIKAMNVSFCNCSYTCSCKERFIKLMKKEEDIDLIFE